LRYLALNAVRSPFDDVRVRAAVSLSIDRAKIIARAHDGLAWAPAGLVWPGGPVHGPAAPSPPFAPDQAGTLLDAAGWTDANGDGMRERGSRRLMITVLSTPEKSVERDMVLEGLRKAGFALDIRTGSAAVLANRLAAHDFDLAFVEWTGDMDRDASPLLATGGNRNYGQFSSPEVDRVLTELRAALEPAERAPLAAELSKLLAEACPLVALTAPDPYGLVSLRVGGVAVRDGWISLRDLELLPDRVATE
jgi:peptide/nickel transport system substrate-binding protein